jgi:hypothetical protein
MRARRYGHVTAGRMRRVLQDSERFWDFAAHECRVTTLANVRLPVHARPDRYLDICSSERLVAVLFSAEPRIDVRHLGRGDGELTEAARRSCRRGRHPFARMKIANVTDDVTVIRHVRRGKGCAAETRSSQACRSPKGVDAYTDRRDDPKSTYDGVGVHFTYLCGIWRLETLPKPLQFSPMTLRVGR